MKTIVLVDKIEDTISIAEGRGDKEMIWELSQLLKEVEFEEIDTKRAAKRHRRLRMNYEEEFAA